MLAGADSRPSSGRNFAAELADGTGLSLELDQPGGMQFFLSDDEAEEFVGQLTSLRDALSGDYPFEYLGHNAAKAYGAGDRPRGSRRHLLPARWPCEPALFAALSAQSGARALAPGSISGPAVDRIDPLASGFRIHRAGRRLGRRKNIVLCAGHGTARLAPMVGLDAPVKPNRGQVLVTERVRPFIRYPSGRLRQVGEGAVQIGDSKEDVGLDDATTGDVVGDRSRIERCAAFPSWKTYAWSEAGGRSG